jgi:hypothetical protein
MSNSFTVTDTRDTQPPAKTVQENAHRIISERIALGQSGLTGNVAPPNTQVSPIVVPDPAVNIFSNDVEQYKIRAQPRRVFWFDFGLGLGTFSHGMYQLDGMEIDRKMRTDPEYHKTIGPYSQPMLERAAANMRDTIESYMQSLTDADAEVMPYLAGINEEKDAIQQELDYVCAFMARRRAYEDSVMDTVIARLDANDTMKREKTKVYTD